MPQEVKNLRRSSLPPIKVYKQYSYGKYIWKFVEPDKTEALKTMTGRTTLRASDVNSLRILYGEYLTFLDYTQEMRKVKRDFSPKDKPVYPSEYSNIDTAFLSQEDAIASEEELKKRMDNEEEQIMEECPPEEQGDGQIAESETPDVIVADQA